MANDNDSQIDRLENLMERLINVNLSNQEQIGFLAATFRDTRQNIGDRLAHLETELIEINHKIDTGLRETNRKIDIILQHITGMNGNG